MNFGHWLRIDNCCFHQIISSWLLFSGAPILFPWQMNNLNTVSLLWYSNIRARRRLQRIRGNSRCCILLFTPKKGGTSRRRKTEQTTFRVIEEISVPSISVSQSFQIFFLVPVIYPISQASGNHTSGNSASLHTIFQALRSYVYIIQLKAAYFRSPIDSPLQPRKKVLRRPKMKSKRKWKCTHQLMDLSPHF